MDKNAIHDLEEILAERRVTLVRATILDRDNQPLATGTGVVRSEGTSGHSSIACSNSSSLGWFCESVAAV